MFGKFICLNGIPASWIRCDTCVFIYFMREMISLMATARVEKNVFMKWRYVNRSKNFLSRKIENEEEQMTRKTRIDIAKRLMVAIRVREHCATQTRMRKFCRTNGFELTNTWQVPSPAVLFNSGAPTATMHVPLFRKVDTTQFRPKEKYVSGTIVTGYCPNYSTNASVACTCTFI